MKVYKLISLTLIFAFVTSQAAYSLPDTLRPRAAALRLTTGKTDAAKEVNGAPLIAVMRKTGQKRWVRFAGNGRAGFNETQRRLIENTLLEIISTAPGYHDEYRASPRIYKTLNINGVLNDVTLYTVPEGRFYRALRENVRQYNRTHSADGVSFLANWRLCSFQMTLPGKAKAPEKCLFIIRSTDETEDVAGRLVDFARSVANRPYAKALLEYQLNGHSTIITPPKQAEIKTALERLTGGLFTHAKRPHKATDRVPPRRITSAAALKARTSRAQVESIALYMEAADLAAEAGRLARAKKYVESYERYKLAAQKLQESRDIVKKRTSDRITYRIERLSNEKEMEALEAFNDLMARYLTTDSLDEARVIAKEMAETFSIRIDKTGVVSGGVVNDLVKNNRANESYLWIGNQQNGRGMAGRKRIIVNSPLRGDIHRGRNVLCGASLNEDGLLRLTVYFMDGFNPVPCYTASLIPSTQKAVSLLEEYKNFILGQQIPRRKSKCKLPQPIGLTDGDVCLFTIDKNENCQPKATSVFLGNPFAFYDEAADERGMAWFLPSENNGSVGEYDVFFEPDGPAVLRIRWNAKKGAFERIGGVLMRYNDKPAEHLKEWTLDPGYCAKHDYPEDQTWYFDSRVSESSKILVYGRFYIYTGLRLPRGAKVYIKNAPSERMCSADKSIARVDVFSGPSYALSTRIGAAISGPEPPPKTATITTRWLNFICG